ncbi:hypothetical protein LTR95_009008 [Oleoguttula sp. CCFEE 5521]
MAPSAILSEFADVVPQKKHTLGLPGHARARLEKAGVDLSEGYPAHEQTRRTLFSAAKEVKHLTAHIGTEIVGLQLKDLTDQQKDELALLIADGYSAYKELSPEFRKIIDGRSAVFRSAHAYPDRENPNAGPKYIERTHSIVRVQPATGWKSLFVNRAMTDRIVGLDKVESDVILGCLFKVYESNVDIQVRFKWTHGSSALWDNRITMYNASYDYGGLEPRHGTRMVSLAEKPLFKADAPTRRQALGLAGKED